MKGLPAYIIQKKCFEIDKIVSEEKGLGALLFREAAKIAEQKKKEYIITFSINDDFWVKQLGFESGLNKFWKWKNLNELKDGN